MRWASNTSCLGYHQRFCTSTERSVEPLTCTWHGHGTCRPPKQPGNSNPSQIVDIIREAKSGTSTEKPLKGRFAKGNGMGAALKKLNLFGKKGPRFPVLKFSSRYLEDLPTASRSNYNFKGCLQELTDIVAALPPHVRQSAGL